MDVILTHHISPDLLVRHSLMGMAKMPRIKHRLSITMRICENALFLIPEKRKHLAVVKAHYITVSRRGSMLPARPTRPRTPCGHLTHLPLCPILMPIRLIRLTIPVMVDTPALAPLCHPNRPRQPSAILRQLANTPRPTSATCTTRRPRPYGPSFRMMGRLNRATDRAVSS